MGMITSGILFSWLRPKEFFAVSEMTGRHPSDPFSGSAREGSAKVDYDWGL